MSNSRDNEGGVAEGSQRDHVNAISEVMRQIPGDFECEARFTYARCASKSEQAHVGAREQRFDRLHLLPTANQRREGDRKGLYDWLNSITRRWLWKNDEIVLHIQSLSSVQAMLSTACCK